MAIWSGKGSTKKLAVKLKELKLEGLTIERDQRVKMAIEVKWEGPLKSGFSSLYKKSHQAESFFSKEIQLLNSIEPIKWNNEFDSICSFSINSKDSTSFSPWIVSFHILYAESEEQSSSSSLSGKMQVIGKVKLNLGELASKKEAQIEQKLPISLELNGIVMESSLQVVVSFIEMKNTSHSRTLSDNWFKVVQHSSEPPVLRRANSHGAALVQEKAKKKKPSLFGKQLSLKNFGQPPSSAATLKSESEYVVVASSSKTDEPNSVTESRSSLSSETQLDMVTKGGFWKWKRESREKTANQRNLKLIWKQKSLITLAAGKQGNCDKAAGVSACAAIVAIIAHWLQLNPVMTLTGTEFDRLIAEGSLEWRKLCNNESNKSEYADHHFDLDTILSAELRPLVVLPNNSRFGFFHPEEFDHLKDAASFDEIWKEINTDVNELEPRVYIVRWNEHFFILKIEANANYIIDSLGERLYEGCNQAYVLRQGEGEEKNEGSKDKKDEEEKDVDKVICRGKECCKEYMKRFLAAIPLRELKDEEAKGKTVDVFMLYKRLQIDFHLSSNNSSAASTANTSITPSPDNDPLVDDDEFVQV
ncbi:DNA gyrase subunit A [Bienertia sinuspersici]